MGNLQVLFIILFGIYFATTVSTTGKLYPFDTTAIAARDWFALMRCAVALLVLDIAPFAYFIWALRHIPNRTSDFVTDWRAGLGVLFASLATFGIYRLFLALMMIRRSGGKKFFFYSEPDDWKDSELRFRLADGRFPDKATAPPFLTVLLGGAVWSIFCLAVFCYAI